MEKADGAARRWEAGTLGCLDAKTIQRLALDAWNRSYLFSFPAFWPSSLPASEKFSIKDPISTYNRGARKEVN
jgi:hypothetical protein